MTRAGQVFTTLSPVAPLPPPLPASAVEYWLGDRNASAVTAVGLLRGLSLPALGKPVVGQEPGNFNNRSVYQASAANNGRWISTSLATFLASGTYPWIYVVGRWRVAAGASAVPLTALGVSNTSNVYVLQHAATTNVRQLALGGALLSNATGDTSVHRMKAWVEGSILKFDVDGTVAQAGTGTALSGNVIKAAIGCTISSGPGTDTSLAFYLVCSSKPTAAEEAALDGWACTYYGLSMKPPLPATCTEFWQGEFGASVTKAVGQKAGYTINSQGTPAVGADGAFFNGRTVYLASENNNWVSSIGAALFPSGSRPWVYCVARQRSYNDVFNRSHVGIGDFGGFGTTQTSNMGWRAPSHFGWKLDDVHHQSQGS